MSPASRTLGVIGFVMALCVQPTAAPAQAQAHDSALPSRFDPIARRMLTLKVKGETLRRRLDDGWPPPGWDDSLRTMHADVVLLQTEARRLNDEGLQIAPQLVALVDRTRASLDALAHAQDPRSARTALTHFGAGLDALGQKIAEGEACCR